MDKKTEAAFTKIESAIEKAVAGLSEKQVAELAKALIENLQMMERMAG